MIKDPPLLKIRRNFPRPDAQLLRRLNHVQTGFLVDCMDGRGALDYRIKPLAPDNCRFTGTALTCFAGPADNLAVFAALEVAQPGDVIVAGTDGFTQACVTGDLLLGMARNRGVSGFVTDGLVRDVEGILYVEMPTFCLGVTPNSCARTGPGTVGLPLSLGGVTVESGDVIVGDRDGVVVVPRQDLARVCQQLTAVQEAEADMARRVRLGLKNIESVQQLLASDRTEYLD
ncbi:MAG: RraA family protein [Candidatus Latescibacteria bacterium]|nr:RraA family protein [Candidatus Latescibacterota bacterium]